jgi:hypothetical protein
MLPAISSESQSQRTKNQDQIKPLPLRLETQTELSSPPLFTHSIQKPRNSLLLRKTRTVKVSPDNERKLIFAYAVLANSPSQWRFIHRSIPGMVVSVGLRLCTASGERGGRAEADALGEDDARVIACESRGSGKFVDVAV